MVKRFLDRVKENNREYSFQDVKLEDFLRGKETGRRAKDEWLQLISDSINVRLGHQDDSSTTSLIKFATVIPNTESWQQSSRTDEELEQAFGRSYD